LQDNGAPCSAVPTTLSISGARAGSQPAAIADLLDRLLQGSLRAARLLRLTPDFVVLAASDAPAVWLRGTAVVLVYFGVSGLLEPVVSGSPGGCADAPGLS